MLELNKSHSKNLLAVHDSNLFGYGFDFSNFLMLAEIERVKNGCDKIDVLFITGSVSHKEVWKEKAHIFHNIALEFLRLLSSVGNIITLDNVNEFSQFHETFKEKYILFPKEYPAGKTTNNWLTTVLTWGRNPSMEIVQSPLFRDLRAPSNQVNHIRQWIVSNVYPDIPVTITLREDSSNEHYNNSIHDWQLLIDSYADSDYKFIILRDYSKLYDIRELVGHNIIYFDTPVEVLSLRAALYQESTLNLFVSNGCMALGLYNKLVRYIIFASICFDQQINLHFNSKYQQILCNGDNFEGLKTNINIMLKKLSQNDDLIPKYYRDNFEINSTDSVNKEKQKILNRYAKLYNPKYLKKFSDKYISMWTNKQKRILIYGAGFHMDYLFKWTKIADANIVGVADKDQGKHGIKYFGFSIISPEEIKKLNPDIILISSNAFQDEIYTELKYLEVHGIEIFRIYNN